MAWLSLLKRMIVCCDYICVRDIVTDFTLNTGQSKRVVLDKYTLAIRFEQTLKITCT
jgi:hypothetical protein